jgi:DNA-binding transcriptional MerR regulator
VSERPERKKLRIGAVEERTGLTRDTIHYYVREGLVHAPEKTGATVAWYDQRHVAKLRAIRALRTAGLPVAAVKRLLEDPSVAALSLAALSDLGRSLAAVGLREVPRAAVCDEGGRALAASLRLADRLDENPALCDAVVALSSALGLSAMGVVRESLAPSLRSLAVAVVGEDAMTDPASLAKVHHALSVALASLASSALAEAITLESTAARRRAKRG